MFSEKRFTHGDSSAASQKSAEVEFTLRDGQFCTRYKTELLMSIDPPDFDPTSKWDLVLEKDPKAKAYS